MSRHLRNSLSTALLAGAAIAPLTITRPARAQVFNQIIPEGITGSDVEPDVTVLSRQRTGYDNGGIRAGNVVVRPILLESLGYETNVLGTARPRGSSLIETLATLDLLSSTSRSTVFGGALVDDSRYLDQASQSTTNWNVHLGGAFNLGRDVANVYLSHDNQTQTQRDLGVPQLATPLTVVLDRAQFGYRTDLGRLRLTPEIEVNRYSYNSGIVNGAVYDQSNRNRVAVTPGITAAYELATRRSAVLVVRDTTSTYSHTTATIPKRDFNDVELLGGIDYDFNGVLRARILAGYERRTFSSSAYPTIQAPIAELTLIYNPTGLTTVTGTVSRHIQDSADESTAATTTLSGIVRVDHELRRNVILGLTGSITQSDYGSGTLNSVGFTGSSASQLLYEGKGSATYLFNRYMSASATYDILARTSSSPTALNFNGFSTGSNYVDHRFLLQLKIAL